MGWCRTNFLSHRSLKSADNVRLQLSRIMKRFELPMVSTDFNSKDYYINIRKAILAGHFMQVAHLEKTGHYLTVKDNQVHVSPTILIGSRLLEFIHLPAWITNRSGVAIMSLCWLLVISFEQWAQLTRNGSSQWLSPTEHCRLIDLAPHYFNMSNFPPCEAKRELERVLQRRKQSK